jgi:broad specificity phosphatase PhoE
MKRFTKINKQLKEPHVYFIRHGHTDLNGTTDSADRIRGHVDVPLNDDGREDAKKAGEKLKDKPIDYMYSSDLSRAAETADIINEQFHVPVEYTDALRPWNLGDYQGRLTKEVIGDLNNMVRHEDIIPEGGESFKAFRLRFLAEVKNIITNAVKKKQSVIIVAHYRNAKTIDAWISMGAPDDLTLDPEVMIKDNFDPGEIMELPLKKMVK